MRPLFLAAICCTAATATAAGLSSRDRVPEAVPSGPAVHCIPLTSIRETQVRDDRTIDFITRARSPGAYRVTLPYACPELGFERRFAYETSLSELCSTDIITVLHEAPLTRGASCGLASFQPVTLAPHR
ncbi:hypothetical protein [Sphingomonas bacterium]|uniref:hypothetical protein n=1 Tax=Sphingomonas bacterium TaxID=1895847 RepID=UPI0015755B16|nr:hypothetical protein [Sphingomonas bacterium]